MNIGDVFAKAWQLWRRDVGWLILAGLVVGLIVGVIAIVVVAIVAGMLAVSVGGVAFSTSGGSPSITGLSYGTLAAAAVIGIVGYLVAYILALVFAGGMFEMVIGAAREDRGVDFGDLFSGFRRFGSYVVFWLVMVGITLGIGLLSLIPILGIIVAIAGFVFMVWLSVTWLYVLPMIADQGLGFGDAARRSRQMVSDNGWWWTFGTIVVLGVAFAVVGVVISLVGRASSPLASVLLIVFEIVAGPFAICYISTMYLGCGGEAMKSVAGGAGPQLPPAGPAPYLPSSAVPYVAPLGGAPQPPAPPPPAPPPDREDATVATTAAMDPSTPRASDEAWKAAADPLAPPPAPPAPPAPDAPDGPDA
jgi:hypothetical protein